jgi:hypothetical protein
MGYIADNDVIEVEEDRRRFLEGYPMLGEV